MEQVVKIIKEFNDLGYTCNEEQASKLLEYMLYLQEYNAKVNLTAITDDQGIIVKHFIDSLGAVNDIPEGAKLADIGSGAGFPAVVLKIFRPDLGVTLIESNGKKTTFLVSLIKRLNLDGIEVLNLRAEECGRKQGLREGYDAVTARAVTELNKLIEYALPLLKKGGALYAYKGRVDEELQKASNAIVKLNGALKEARHYELMEQKRSLVIITKEGKTPSEYPRQNKKIISNPL
ncbi:MAG: 16S rRNA (guanine(527)-N(7))-methyltransferase RsmG [Clostridia bacterium]|nr:16S rRNA (guanine(527)-N(7))-methyltransferase RsmG [Clostridia bacterium]